MPVEKVTVTPGVRKYFSALGKRGTGAAKRRTAEQCRAAAKSKTPAQCRAAMIKAWETRKTKAKNVAKPTL